MKNSLQQLVEWWDNQPVSPGLALIVDFPTTVANFPVPAGFRFVDIIAISGGGGGGSGRRGAAGGARYGGGAGSGGSVSVTRIQLADLPAGSWFINVGAGGNGGAAIGVDDSDGNGGVGGLDTFIDHNVSGQELIFADGGAPGLGGTNAAGTGGVPLVGMFLGGPGADASVAGVPATPADAMVAGGGGGAGGSITALNASLAGGDGGAGGAVQGGYLSPVFAGGAVDTAGDATTDALSYPPVALNGAGGGGAYSAAAAGAGGAGLRGSGGGGGGASLNANPSGAGGDGGDGFVRLVFSH